MNEQQQQQKQQQQQQYLQGQHQNQTGKMNCYKYIPKSDKYSPINANADSLS